ncbi:MAG: hypothetical protein U1F76_19295 [Candidatus Competibacteraceae bacterium]
MIIIFPKDRCSTSDNGTIRSDKHYPASPATPGGRKQKVHSDPVLADILSRQWVRTDAALPPAATTVLYLGYSSDTSASTLHCGRYDPHRQSFIEQGSGATLPQEAVLAWMPIPRLPEGIYKDCWFMPLCRYSKAPHVALD